MKPFKFLENIATADVAVEAFGKNLNELFENAALALFETMAETKKVSRVTSYKLQVTSSNLEDLLFDFLSELVFLKDEKATLFSRFKVKIKKLDAKRLTLDAEILGEEINPEKHDLKVDVKAVTRHQFGIRKEKDRFIARVVLDI